MQTICDSKRSARSALSDQAGFGVLLAVFVCASAALATLAPIAFSIATVFLFAGPHNWVELRYFLSRLPSRLGPLAPFFCSSFAGVLILGVTYAALNFMGRLPLLEFDTIILCFKAWILAFHAWLALLVCTRGSHLQTRRSLILAVLVLTAGCSLAAPLWFGLSLVYMHPLIGLAILDRELKRSRPQWVQTYRTALLLLPLLICWMVLQLSNTANLPADTDLNQQITRHAGSFLLPDASSHMLVSLHTFLEMLHYGVWLFAIPIATSAFQRQRWQPDNMPVSRQSTFIRKLLYVVFAASSILVILLWLAFMGNYAATRELYFSVAVFHILAELPFLLWML